MRERIPTSIRSNAERLAGNVLWHGSKAIARHDVVSQYGHIEKARKHLENGGSLIVVVTHPHGLDPLVAGLTIEEYFSSLDRPVAGITALKHFDPERHRFDKTVKQVEYILIDLARKARRFEILRVVQRSEAEREYYTKHPEALGGKSIDQFNADSIEQAIDILRNGGIVMVAPEGTRSKDGNLSEAQPGTELLLRAAKDKALVLPIGMNLPEDGKFRPGIDKFRVVIGEPFSYEDLEKDHRENPTVKRKDLIMRRVAKLIPRGKRGVYESLF